MKNLLSGVLSVVLSIGFLNSQAQNVPSFREMDRSKPKLFADLPERMNLKVTDMDVLFEMSVGQNVNLNLGNLNYRGKIVSKSDNSDVRINSIVIKSTNRTGAVLTFTKIQKEDQTFMYRGRILSSEHSDAYSIELENGKYMLTKKQLADIVAE